MELQIGTRVRVKQPVPSYQGCIGDLTPDVVATVQAVRVPSVRATMCDHCKRRHTSFVLLAYPSKDVARIERWPDALDTAATYPCNLSMAEVAPLSSPAYD